MSLDPCNPLFLRESLGRGMGEALESCFLSYIFLKALVCKSYLKLKSSKPVVTTPSYISYLESFVKAPQNCGLMVWGEARP